jgi:N-acetylglucosamine kinase-like BadF-type ATPase
MTTAAPSEFLVGVDAGGSHTEVVVADEQLIIRARVRGPAGAVRPGSLPTAARAIVATVRQALGEAGVTGVPRALVVGAAGTGRAQERRALGDALLEAHVAHRVEVTTDAAIALESVFHQAPGILLVAGSGSIAYARDPSGVVWRAGGLGWQMGDEGSGYALGRAALGTVGRAADGRGSATELSAALARYTNAPSLDDLVQWAGAASPGAVAALAKLVQEAAQDGDRVAQELVAAAAEELALHVLVLLQRFPAEAAVPFALAGGILTPGFPVREALLARMADHAPRLSLVSQGVDPPRGALALAARLPATESA